MAALIALAAAAGAVILVAATWLAATRASARNGQARVERTIVDLTDRVDELSAELERVLRRAERREAHGELTSSLDLDDLLARVVGMATSLDGARAAVVSVSGEDGEPMLASAGMPISQAREETFAGPPRRAGESRSRLAFPLDGELGRLGFLVVYSASAEHAAGELRGELVDLAKRAGPAVDNALRYREARRLADLDALTALRNRRFFHDTLQRECARAKRYGRGLALLVLDVDDFKAINERFGHLAGDSVLAEAAQRLSSALRASDVACRVGGDEFAVVLPEASSDDAQQLYRRIVDAVTARPIGNVEHLSFSAGIAALGADDDARSFFERADNALYRAKNAGKARVVPSDA
jgi:diguanylate cyclase (GGDEF)-like protein